MTTPIEDVAQAIRNMLNVDWWLTDECHDEIDTAIAAILSRPDTLAKLRPQVESELLRDELGPSGLLKVLVSMSELRSDALVMRDRNPHDYALAAAELRKILGVE